MDYSKIINGRFIVVVSLCILSVFAFSACMGVDLGDFMKVKTTIGIQQSEGLPATLTLNDAEYEYNAWFEKVQREGTEWRARISKSRENAQLFGSLFMQLGREAATSPAVAAVPGLALLLGFFIKRPGDKSASETESEKRASYNKARKDVLTSIEGRYATTNASDTAATEIIEALKAEIAKTK